MSIDNPESDYLCLPRLTRVEGTALEMALDEDINPIDSVHCIARMVMERNPAIQQVVNHDIQQYYEYETSDDIPEGDLALFADGIQDGYEFFIGCVTWVRWQRSGVENISVFMQSAALCGDVPLVGKPQLQQIKRVRSGNALLQPGTTEDIDSSKDLSYKHAGDYFFESMRFQDVLNMYTADASSTVNPEECPFVEGIKHGVQNAIEMYLIAEEEEILFQNLAHLAPLLLQLGLQGKE